MRIAIFVLGAALVGCSADRDALGRRPVDKWFDTARPFDDYERCLRSAEARFGPITSENEGNRRHIRFGDDVLLTLSPGPDDLTRIEIRARGGYPPRADTVTVTTVRQLIEHCL